MNKGTFVSQGGHGLGEKNIVVSQTIRVEGVLPRFQEEIGIGPTSPQSDVEQRRQIDRPQPQIF